MGELHDVVSALLDAFALGISVIRAQRSRRREEQLPVDPAQQTAETHVRKSLRKSRTDVDEAYRRDLARFGPGFASGDAEARSALSKILLRLNAAFVSIIERFTKGRSTRADYHTLMSLSNASRLEAIQTFDHLSRRLPQSALSLTSSSKPAERHAHSSPKRRTKHSASTKDAHHQRSQSTPSLIAPGAPDQPRPKHTRKRASSKASTTLSKTPRATAEKHRVTGSQKPTSKNTNNNSRAAAAAAAAASPRSSSRTRPQSERLHAPRSSRSDSTKLGEIPERKWTSSSSSSLRVAYPLYAYPAPPKQRSRFMRFFGK